MQASFASPNAKNPLDNSAVHPESYHIVEQMAKDHGCTIKDLIGNKSLLSKIDIQRYIHKGLTPLSPSSLPPRSSSPIARRLQVMVRIKERIIVSLYQLIVRLQLSPFQEVRRRPILLFLRV